MRGTLFFITLSIFFTISSASSMLLLMDVLNLPYGMKTTVFLPLGTGSPVVSVSVQWGDGSSNIYTSPTFWSDGTAGITHDYSFPGIYQINISPYGDGPVFLSQFGWQDTHGWLDWATAHFGATLKGISTFGDLGITSLRGCFSKTNALSLVPPALPSTATDLGYLFFLNSYFNMPLNSWDVSNVTNMQSMFMHAQGFNQPLSSWDVRKVSNMDGTFQGASSFQQSLASWCVPLITTRPANFADTSMISASQEPIWGCAPPAEVPAAAPALSPVFIEAPISSPVVGATAFAPIEPELPPTELPASAPTDVAAEPSTASKKNIMPAIAMLHHNSRSCDDTASTRSLVSAVWHRGSCSLWSTERDYRMYYQVQGEPSDVIHERLCRDDACSEGCIENSLSTKECAHSRDSFFAIRPSNASDNELGSVLPIIDVNVHASFVISISYPSLDSCRARDLTASVAQYWNRRGNKICVPSDSNPNLFFKYDCTLDGRIQVQTFSDANCKPHYEIGSPQEFMILDSCVQSHPLTSSGWNYGGPGAPWTLSCATGAKLVADFRNQPVIGASTVVRVSADSVNVHSSSNAAASASVLAAIVAAFFAAFVLPLGF